MRLTWTLTALVACTLVLVACADAQVPEMHASETTAEATPSGSIRTRLVLSSHKVISGGSIRARVIVINNTGKALHGADCFSPFLVGLSSKGIHDFAFANSCRQELVIPEGRSSWKSPVEASYGMCGHGGGIIECWKHGGMPPLPPGRYVAKVTEAVDPPDLVPLPRPSVVQVTERR